MHTGWNRIAAASAAAAALFAAGVVAPSSLAAGEYKAEWPFVQESADLAASQPRLPATGEPTYGEPKNQWPFTRPVSIRALR
jgi:hypothetical protein